MPSLVNELLHSELEQDCKAAGSCLVLEFDGVTVSEISDLRNQFRENDLSYKVVKNRIAAKAAETVMGCDLSPALGGKCGIVFAPEERAISAAKLVREAMKPKKKNPTIKVKGGIIEGEVIAGAAAATIADMPDRDSVRAMIATAIIGPARSLATVLNAVPSGVARCIQAKSDKEG